MNIEKRHKSAHVCPMFYPSFQAWDDILKTAWLAWLFNTIASLSALCEFVINKAFSRNYVKIKMFVL